MPLAIALALAFVFAGAGEARADPTGGVVSSAIASAILSAGGPLVIGAAAVNAAVFTGQLIAAGIGAAVYLGGSYALQRALGGAASPGNFVNSTAVRGMIKQASVPQRIVFGRARISGIVYLYEVIPPKLYLGLIHSSLPIGEFGKVTVEEREVVFNRSGSIWTPVAEPFVVSGSNRIRAAFQEGTFDQPVNPLAAIARPDLGANFRLPGLPNAVYEFDYGADFDEFQALWGQVQIPNPLVETAQGAPVYDPRRPLQRWPADWRDAEDVADAIATWQPTRTAALIQAFWRAARFGLQAGFDGTDWDEVAKAANFDEYVIGTKDGEFIQRGVIDGVVTLDERPNSIMDSMLTANRGFQVRRAGKGWIEPAQPKDPTFTIADDDILGAIQFRRDKPKRERKTRASALFVSPLRQFTEVETPPLIKEAEIVGDGEEFEAKLRLAFTGDHQNAQRIVKEYVEESLLERSVTVVCRMRLFGVRDGYVGRVQLRKYPFLDGIYQVEEWALADDRASVTFTLSEFDKQIPVDWNPQNDEQDFPALGEAA